MCNHVLASRSFVSVLFGFEGGESRVHLAHCGVAAAKVASAQVSHLSLRTHCSKVQQSKKPAPGNSTDQLQAILQEVLNFGG